MRLEGKSLKSDFLRFIIPSIIAQWVFSLYTMVDGIFVARGVSEVALTAVNISMPFTTGLFLSPSCLQSEIRRLWQSFWDRGKNRRRTKSLRRIWFYYVSCRC